jgi:hypothetical protein
MTSPSPSQPTAQPAPAPWTRPTDNPLTLIGLAGRAGTGKDSIAAGLADRHNALRYAFALPLKAGLQAMLGLDPEDLEDRERKEQVIEWLGASPRYLMQTLGTQWGRELVAPDLWVRLARRVIEEARTSPEFGYSPALVISDVRFPDEAALIRELGGWVVHVRRLDAPPVVEHVSETALPFVAGDLVLDNNGTLHELDAMVDSVFAEIRRLDLAQSFAGWDGECAP